VRNEWENADTGGKNKKGCFWVFGFYVVSGFFDFV